MAEAVDDFLLCNAPAKRPKTVALLLRLGFTVCKKMIEYSRRRNRRLLTPEEGRKGSSYQKGLYTLNQNNFFCNKNEKKRKSKKNRENQHSVKM